MEKRPSSRLAEWLEGLARESWQLELIISGFAIFLLAEGYEPLREAGQALQRLGLSWRLQFTLGVPFGILMASWFILLVNLVAHVVLRGLWISAVGLRSVSDDIDFESLQLQPRFFRFLKRRIGSFDNYIEQLEKICSVLFAFTFMIIFMLLAVAAVTLLINLVNLVLTDWLELKNHSLVYFVNITLILLGLLYFIDFVTLSRLKRIRWLTPVYYPVYRFFSIVTLSALYRPLYYNLIDNRFGRRVGLLLVPYLLLLMILSSMSFGTNIYFPDKWDANYLNTAYYDDLRSEKHLSFLPSIPSRFMENGFLEVFLPYTPRTDDQVIQAVCPALIPAGTSGLKLNGPVKINFNSQPYSTDSLLQCMSSIHRIYVNDSLHADPDFRFFTHPQRQDKGLHAILDLQYLPRGEHLLRVESQRLGGNKVEWMEMAQIPFWKE